MSLSCKDYYGDGWFFFGPDDFDGWFFFGPDDFSTLDRKRAVKCCSCGGRIAPGDDCGIFLRTRYAVTDIELRICGDEIELAPWFMCERCTGLYFSLDDLGFCVSIGGDMRELVKEYAEVYGSHTKGTP